MTNQLDTEDWKAFHAEWQAHKAEKRAVNTTLIYKFCVAYSVNCEAKTPYHFRLIRQGFYPVDVFPTSEKVHVLDKISKYKKVDVIKFLTNYFK